MSPPPWGVNLVPDSITDIVVITGETTTVNIIMKKGGIISGKVICHAGNPVANARVSVRDSVTGGSGRPASTDANGNYIIMGLATGTYNMTVHPQQGGNLALTFITDTVVTAGETTIMNVIMKKGGIISGKVICHAGNPVANAQVSVRNQITRIWDDWASTDANGNYSIRGLATGTYEMSVRPRWGNNLALARITDIVVTAGKTTTVNVTMKLHALSINVTPNTVTLNVTETQQFTIATVLPAKANQTVTWSVDNTTVGTINATGFFRVISVGTVNVIAKSVVDGNITGTAIVVVPPAPTAITISPATATHNVTETQQLSVP